MIFVSYSWGESVEGSNKENVWALAAKLRELGYDVNLDIMDIQKTPSLNFAKMMAKNLMEAEKVILILSEDYKKKADSFDGGVGTEYEFIINDIKKNEKKYILCAFTEVSDLIAEKITPGFLNGRRVIGITPDTDLKESELIYALSEENKFEFPEVAQAKYVPQKFVVTKDGVAIQVNNQKMDLWKRLVKYMDEFQDVLDDTNTLRKQNFGSCFDRSDLQNCIEENVNLYRPVLERIDREFYQARRNLQNSVSDLAIDMSVSLRNMIKEYIDMMKFTYSTDGIGFTNNYWSEFFFTLSENYEKILNVKREIDVLIRREYQMATSKETFSC